MDNAIHIKDLVKQYHNFELDSVSFDIPKGYITGFIGPNGSGKTTTIKLMLSYLNANSGTVEVLGHAIDNREYLQDVGVVLDSNSLVKEWSMRDIDRVNSMFYTHWNSDTFFMYLSRFEIDKSMKVSELSRGMNVKLMLAIALSHDAKLLILDEPTSGLDPVAREQICDILQDFVSDEAHSVFFSTHITSDLESISDYIVFILNGSIVYSGTKDALLDEYVLIKGGPQDLSIFEKRELIGLKKYSTGFEALISKKDVPLHTEAYIVEPVTLEQLILFFNRGGYHEENS